MKAHLKRRLDFALAGFGDLVEQVLVRLSAKSIPASPFNRCEIEVKLRPRKVRIAETGLDLFVAVENAAEHLRRSVSRALERERAWGNGAFPERTRVRRKAVT